MKIAIIGKRGNCARLGLAQAGHQITYGARKPEDDKAKQLKAAQPQAAITTNTEAAHDAEVVVFSKSRIRDQPQVKKELEDVFDGNERPAAVVIQRPYIVKCNALRIQADGAEEIPM